MSLLTGSFEDVCVWCLNELSPLNKNTPNFNVQILANDADCWCHESCRRTELAAGLVMVSPALA